MKVVILAGGRGTRLSEETSSIPKPMVEIGGKPILWHIMKSYSRFGFNDFIICLGYKGYLIKEYFSHYFLHMSDVTIDLKNNKQTVHVSASEPWKITLVDTGLNAMTGGRIKRVKKYIGNKTFLLTYGDGLANIDIKKLTAFHRQHGKAATITAVQLAGRFGALDLGAKDEVASFLEKPRGDGAWINGGFFVLEPEILDYIAGDDTTWEQEPLKNLAKDKKLVAYRHKGFWKCMDTLRDKIDLEDMCAAGNPPWTI